MGNRILNLKEKCFIVFEIKLKESKVILKLLMDKIILYFFKLRTKLLNKVDNINDPIYNIIKVFFKSKVKTLIISIKNNQANDYVYDYTIANIYEDSEINQDASYNSIVLKFDYGNASDEVFSINTIEKIYKSDKRYIYKYI